MNDAEWMMNVVYSASFIAAGHTLFQYILFKGEMRLITLAIHTYDRAQAVRMLLESEGIHVTLQNVNLEQPEVSSGVRIRIPVSDLPLALRIVENPDIFSGTTSYQYTPASHRTIIVPTDFSGHSLNATRMAVRLAAARKADLAFIHAYIDPRMSGSVQLSDNLTYDTAETEATEHIVSAANGQMEKFAESLRAMMKSGELPMARFSTDVVEGVPEEAIVQFAKERSPYLVVMGTRAAERKEKEMIGSVTAEVLDESRFTVLSVPEGLSADGCQAPGNILFFSNLDQEDILAMDTLYRYFPDAQSNVTIVHIPVRNRFTDRTAGRSAIALSEYCRKTFSHFSFKNVPVSPKNALEELEQLQRETKFDLIVVPNRRRNALVRMFSPTLVHRILFRADVPMLVIPV